MMYDLKSLLLIEDSLLAGSLMAMKSLDQFRQQTGLDTILDSLTENPLPHTIVLVPAFGAGNQQADHQYTHGRTYSPSRK